MRTLNLRRFGSFDDSVVVRFRATTSLDAALRRAARAIGSTYVEPVLVNRQGDSTTYHVQFGRYLPRLDGYTLGDLYIAHVRDE